VEHTIMDIKGQAWKFGANVDTDVIIPVRYLISFDPVELGKHCLEGIDPEFAQKVQPGDIIVAAENFGCGSSREHAPVAIRGAASPASSPPPLLASLPNTLNIGCPRVRRGGAAHRTGDTVEIDGTTGRIITKGRPIRLNLSLSRLVAVGGLVLRGAVAARTAAIGGCRLGGGVAGDGIE
jgi:3-isopropylmalate/(R)-2-methylmalate dehydratase small subunit